MPEVHRVHVGFAREFAAPGGGQPGLEFGALLDGQLRWRLRQKPRVFDQFRRKEVLMLRRHRSHRVQCPLHAPGKSPMSHIWNDGAMMAQAGGFTPPPPRKTAPRCASTAWLQAARRRRGALPPLRGGID